MANNINQETTFSITDTKLYVPVGTLSTHNNAGLLEQLKSALKKQLTGIYIDQKYQQKNKSIQINI